MSTTGRDSEAVTPARAVLTAGPPARAPGAVPCGPQPAASPRPTALSQASPAPRPPAPSPPAPADIVDLDVSQGPSRSESTVI